MVFDDVDSELQFEDSWLPKGFEGPAQIEGVKILKDKRLEFSLRIADDLQTYRAQVPMWSQEVREIAQKWGVVPRGWVGKTVMVDTVSIPWKGGDKAVRRLRVPA